MHIQELGHVVLYVRDISTMAKFYGETLGFRQILREGPVAAFSSSRTHHELLLIEIGDKPKHEGIEPGLYHIGFKIGNSTEELRAAYRELKTAGVHIVGSADHYVTHSLYIMDPDGNELELYADVSDAWKTDPTAMARPTQPLDLE
jgi:catechol-2,3-dioxygenase